MGLEFIYNRLVTLKSLLSKNGNNKPALHTNPISQNNIEYCDNEPARVDSATVLSQYYNIHQNKSQKPIVKPMVFPPIQRGGERILFNDNYCYPHYDREKARFSSNAQAKDLEIRVPDHKVIEISNFDDPSGTIAGSTTLDKTLYTDRLIECAALAVVDKAHNTQTLIHVFPGYTVESNQQLINHVLNSSNPKDIEVSLVPGQSIYTRATVQFILDTVKEYSPDVDVKLFNFPEDGLKIANRGVLLHNGELYCCDMNNVVDKVTNPKENISYIEQVKLASSNDEIFQKSLEKADFDTEFDFEKLKKWAIDNNLGLESFGGGTGIDFLDDKKRVVRTVMADYSNQKAIKKDERIFYNPDGSIKGQLEKNENNEVVYYYQFDDTLKMPTATAYLHNDCWCFKRFGEFKKLPINPITGEPQ